MQHYVVGIDPSLTRTGLAICPLDWGGDWSKVRLMSFPTTPFGKGPGDRMRRCALIVDRVAQALYGLGNCSLNIFIEGYSFDSGARAHHLGELGGEFRRRIGIEQEVPPSTAKKRLLGKVPREGAKQAVYDALVAAGGKFENLDEADAMCICNFGLGEHGGFNFQVGT